MKVRAIAGREVAVLLALSFAFELWFLFGLPLPAQVTHVPDDSFFYLRVAQWFWPAGEFTFDGVNPTYGYQPLWQLVLCALAPLLPGRAALLHGAMVVCALLHIAIGGALFALTRRLLGATAGAIAALFWIWNPATAVWCWGLKENGLYALLLVLALLRLHTLLVATPTRRQALGYGALLGAIVFTRLNALLVSGILLLALPLARGLGGGLRARTRAAAFALPATVVVGAPWYLYAWLHFGSAMPTSGAFKKGMAEGFVATVWGTPWLSFAHGWRALREYPQYLASLFDRGYGPWRGALLALLAIAPVAFARRAWRARWPRARAAWFVLALAAATALLASFADQMLLPNYIGYADWYAVAFQIAVPVLAGVLAAPWLARDRRLAFALPVVLLACWLVPATRGAAARLHPEQLTEPPHLVQTLEVGLWAEHATPADARFGLWDPGIISYFSARRCVSFDPLISAVDYLRPEVLGDPVGYVQRQRVAYMFGVAEQKDGAWQYWPLPKGTFDILWMPYPDQDVGWRDADPDKRVYCVVVRPRDAVVPEFLRPDDFPCGVLYPNDPARRRWITRDRDRLLAGVQLQADLLRLRLAVPAGAPPVRLLVDGGIEREFAAGTAGWQYLDARAWRGHRVQVTADGGDAAASVPQAQMVDYELGDR